MTALRHKLSIIRKRWQQAGVTLVELSVVLVIFGLLSWASFSAYETVAGQRERDRAIAAASEVQSNIRSFALRNGRLPCPDTSSDGNGLETLAGGVCDGATQLGWFPYLSLGMTLPDADLRARYAVFRAGTVDPLTDADLAISKERTSDQAGDLRNRDVSDLIVALNNAGRLSLDATHPYLTGDAGRAGAIDCTANRVTTVAYWIVLPLSDRDGDMGLLDAPHTKTNLCATSLATAISVNFDDVVIAESPAQLAGWLRQTLPW